MPEIKVHEKVLGHLSRGLYRSPASALRELVSNAWDADASCVRIDTNFPNFLQVSVEDDGVGFTQAEFVSLMEGGIGNSLKHPNSETTKNGRPTIGRLGIGMLGIAQICGSFTISSKTSDGEGFKARVRLYDMLRGRMDKGEGVQISDGPLQVVEIGEYNLDPNYDASTHGRGTMVIADDIHPTFARAFKESVDALTFKSYKKPPRDWARALKIVSAVHSLQELGDYWRLLWELAASTPVPYISEDALPNEVVKSDQLLLNSYRFRVLVDGIRIAKPVFLKGNSGGYTTVPIDHTELKIYGEELAFHGYIAVQEGLQLRPDELRGILIRVKNVAIGYYDQTMLDYRSNEGPRSRWLTGEIFVERGLEDAINIDRDSFNRFHPQFRALQKRVHDILRDRLFPVVYKNIDVRSAKRAGERAVRQESTLRAVVSEAVGSPVKLTRTAAGESSTVGATIRPGKRQIEIAVPKPESIKAKKQHRGLAAAILSIFEVAIAERGRDRQREVFSRLLQKLLTKW